MYIEDYINSHQTDLIIKAISHFKHIDISYKLIVYFGDSQIILNNPYVSEIRSLLRNEVRTITNWDIKIAP